MEEKKIMPIISYNQIQAYRLWLSAEEAIILEYLALLWHWAKQEEVDGKFYYRLHAEKMISDLPTLWITTKQGVLKVVKWLIMKWLCKRVMISNASYYRVSDDYIRQGVNSSLRQVETPVDTIININNIYNMLAEKVWDMPHQEKKRIIELLSLNGDKTKTDLGDIDIDKVIDVWNSAVTSHNLPKTWKSPNTKMYRELSSLWGDKIQYEYTKEDFNKGFQNYLKDIEQRDMNNSYSQHRFNLFQFLKQSNWLFKFTNI